MIYLVIKSILRKSGLITNLVINLVIRLMTNLMTTLIINLIINLMICLMICLIDSVCVVCVVSNDLLFSFFLIGDKG